MRLKELIEILQEIANKEGGDILVEYQEDDELKEIDCVEVRQIYTPETRQL